MPLRGASHSFSIQGASGQLQGFSEGRGRDVKVEKHGEQLAQEHITVCFPVHEPFLTSFNYRNAEGQVPRSHFQLGGTKLWEVQRFAQCSAAGKREWQLQNQRFPLHADVPFLLDLAKPAGRGTAAPSVMAGMDSCAVMTAGPQHGGKKAGGTTLTHTPHHAIAQTREVPGAAFW